MPHPHQLQSVVVLCGAQVVDKSRYAAGDNSLEREIQVLIKVGKYAALAPITPQLLLAITLHPLLLSGGPPQLHKAL